MRIRQLLPVLVLLFALPIGYHASRCGVYHECSLYSIFNGLSFTVFKPLWVFALYGLLGTVLLPFVQRRVFAIWFGFACMWLVLTMLLIWWAPVAMNSWLPLVSYTKSDVARWMGAAFSFISICIILITSFIPYQKPRKGA